MPSGNPAIAGSSGCDERPARRRRCGTSVSSCRPRSDSCRGDARSTEILKRSEALHGLKFSGELARVSGNGDAIAFGFAAKASGSCIGEPVQQGGPYAVGPTITGMVRTGVRDQDGKWQKLTIEDAAGTDIDQLTVRGAAHHRRVPPSTRRPEVAEWYRMAKGTDPITVAPKRSTTRKSCL